MYGSRTEENHTWDSRRCANKKADLYQGTPLRRAEPGPDLVYGTAASRALIQILFRHQIFSRVANARNFLFASALQV